MLGQANMERGMAIWTVFRNPCYFLCPFHRPRCPGGFRKNGLVLCRQGPPSSRWTTYTAFQAAAVCLAKQTWNGEWQFGPCYDTPATFWVRLIVPGAVGVFAKTALCCVGKDRLARVGRHIRPSRRPRFAWPSKHGTVNGNLDRVTIPLLLFGSVSSSPAPWGFSQKRPCAVSARTA